MSRLVAGVVYHFHIVVEILFREYILVPYVNFAISAVRLIVQVLHCITLLVVLRLILLVAVEGAIGFIIPTARIVVVVTHLQ
jgi:hypothetical protein